MKQLAVLVIVAACGSSRPPAEQRPAPPPVVDEDTGPSPAPKSDPDESGPASVVSPPDAGTATTSRDQPSYVIGTVDNTKALEVAPDMEATTENGVMVIKTDHPQWCGRAKGVCAESIAECSKLWTGCTKVVDYSCFSWKSRTSGKETMMCLRDYGMCQKARPVVAVSEDRTEITDCFVIRHKR